MLDEELIFRSEPDTAQVEEDQPIQNDIASMLDARMNELPDNQKQFFLDNLTPETLAMLGLVLGQEGIEFFQPMTDMSKTITVTEREVNTESLPSEPELQSDTSDVQQEDTFTV